MATGRAANDEICHQVTCGYFLAGFTFKPRYLLLRPVTQVAKIFDHSGACPDPCPIPFDE
jgi:hypothetical protein